MGKLRIAHPLKGRILRGVTSTPKHILLLLPPSPRWWLCCWAKYVQRFVYRIHSPSSSSEFVWENLLGESEGEDIVLLQPAFHAMMDCKAYIIFNVLVQSETHCNYAFLVPGHSLPVLIRDVGKSG